jgi:hypothetical protein
MLRSPRVTWRSMPKPVASEPDMTTLHIPHLGTALTLAQDWTFNFFNEHRNDGLRRAAGLRVPHELVTDFWQLNAVERENVIQKSGWRLASGGLPKESYEIHGRSCHPLTLPAGTLLTIDRIYIRKGQESFDSVTFWLKAKLVPITINGRPLKKSVRFWAKLDDVNMIQFAEGK